MEKHTCPWISQEFWLLRFYAVFSMEKETRAVYHGIKIFFLPGAEEVAW